VPNRSEPTLDRRTVLAGLAGAGTAGLAGCSALTDHGTDAETTDIDPGLANELAVRFAPTVYFDEAEPWFPTDPRPYLTEPDGDPEGTEYAYELVPTSELEAITDFAGPQLSFEFSVPQFAEDAVSGHISTAGVPWEQPRYTNPADDITDPNHRAALADRYDPIGAAAPINRDSRPGAGDRG
jgi:hypothetical protein